MTTDPKELSKLAKCFCGMRYPQLYAVWIKLLCDWLKKV